MAGQAEIAQAAGHEGRAVESAGEVGIQHELPGLGGDFERRGESEGDAGDVAEELDGAEFLLRVVQEVGPGGTVPHVQFFGEVAGAGEEAGGFGEAVRGDVGDDEAHGLRGEGEGDGLADAAGGTGDEGGFAGN